MDVSENELERIDSKIFSSGKAESSLTFLNLSGNYLHFIDSKSAFYGLKKNLKILDLSRNRFSILDSNFFNATPSIEFLDLSGNVLSEVLFLALFNLNFILC